MPERFVVADKLNTERACYYVPASWMTVNDMDRPDDWSIKKFSYYLIAARRLGLVESRLGDGKLLEWRRRL